MKVIECTAAAVAVIVLAGCAEAPAPSDASAPPAESPAPSAATSGRPATAATAAPATPPPPFQAAATVQELMNSTILYAAEDFWGSVTVIVDENGVQELYPETDEQWDEVWAAAITIAESGNLLMMAPRAADEGLWRRYSLRLVEAGIGAAAAAQAKDPEQIFATGEEIYNVCTGCHRIYSPDARETRE